MFVTGRIPPLFRVLFSSKHAILNTPLLDFLKELVEAVPDPSNGGTVDENEAVPKKRTRGKGKAKAKSDPEVKAEDEEDSDGG